jgi:hypothetical protein
MDQVFNRFYLDFIILLCEGSQISLWNLCIAGQFHGALFLTSDYQCFFSPFCNNWIFQLKPSCIFKYNS